MTIEERVSRLERSLRWWRAGGLTGLLGMIVLVAVGAGGEEKPPKLARTLRAELFQLVDEAGTVRAALGTKDGAVGLAFFDSKGKSRASFGTLSSGEASLILMDAEQRGRLAMMTHDESVSLQLGDGKGRTRFRCYTNDDGASGLIFQEDNQSQRFLVGIMPDGRALAFFRDGERIVWTAP
jgi:hypothetical protein